MDSSDASAESEFVHRRIAYEGPTARSIRELKALGLDNVDRIPGYVAGNEDEGPVLAHWCDEQRFHSVVVVTTADHSRRLRRMHSKTRRGLLWATQLPVLPIPGPPSSLLIQRLLPSNQNLRYRNASVKPTDRMPASQPDQRPSGARMSVVTTWPSMESWAVRFSQSQRKGRVQAPGSESARAVSAGGSLPGVAG